MDSNTNIGGGWMGSASELWHALRVVGCDQTDGKFHVDGQIVSFLGKGEEYVVGADTVFYVGGKPRNLAALLNGTSYGVRNVTVI